MTLSFVAKDSTLRVPLPVTTHRVVVPQWASSLLVNPPGPGRAAVVWPLGGRLDAVPARAEPPGRALLRAPAAGLSHTNAQVVAQVAAHGESVAHGRPGAGLFSAAWPLLVALRQRMARGAPDSQAGHCDPGPARPSPLVRPLLGLIARQFRKIDAWVEVPQVQVHDVRQAVAVPAPQPAAAGAAAVADPSQRGRLASMQAAMRQDTQALAGMARSLRRPLARMGGVRPAHPSGPDACMPVLATLCDVVADGLHFDGPVAVARPTALCTGARAHVADGPAGSP